MKQHIENGDAGNRAQSRRVPGRIGTIVRYKSTFPFAAFLLLWLAGLSPALAQVSVVNTARVANPSGVGCTDISSNPGCAHSADATITVTAPSMITVTKTVNPGSGVAVAVGDTLTYTLTAKVTNGPTTAVETLTDTLGSGLTVGSLPAGCSAAGQVITCSLAAGAGEGSHTFTYTAKVTDDAVTSVSNKVVTSTGTCTTCTTTNPLKSTITVNKTVSPGNGSAVSVGDTLTYTLTAKVANAPTSAIETLTDTLGAGLKVGTLPAGCNAAGQVITCSLAVGAEKGNHAFTYTATVDTNATTSVSNTVVPSSGTCGTCTTTNPVDPAITVNKSVNPGNGTAVSPGDTLTYTLKVSVFNSPTNKAEVLTDTLGAGLTVGTLPTGCTAAGQVVTCTLGAGAKVDDHSFVYTAKVGLNATTSVSNRVVTSSGTCVVCSTTNPLKSTITIDKSASPASGTTVSVGDTLSYTLAVKVANAVTPAIETLTDTLGAGLTVGTLPAGCTATGQIITCTLQDGAAIGNHTFTYTAKVGADALTSVDNQVVPSSGTCGACTTTHPLKSVVTVNKTVSPGNGTAVAIGDTLTYTLGVKVANAKTSEPVVLTDTLGAGLVAGKLPAGCTAAGQVVTCTLAAGATVDTHDFVYTATVGADAVTAVSNSVVATGGSCSSCTTSNPVMARIVVVKSSDPASGETVKAGDVVTYTVAVSVINAATTDVLTLTDTLTGGQSLLSNSVVAPAGGNCTASASSLKCTLAANAARGVHRFVYQATVGTDASGSIGNLVAATGGGGAAPECTSCSTQHPVAEPIISVTKSATPGSDVAMHVGDVIEYTLAVNVADAAATSDVVLQDTPSAGLTVGALPAGCSMGGTGISCMLPTGTQPGSYTFRYPATINADAGDTVRNVVLASGGNPRKPPTCLTCETQNKVEGNAQLRLVKTAGVREVHLGDLVRYTLTVENVGATNARAVNVVDTPPAGFSYVSGSLAVVDNDNAGTVSGYNPIRFGGLDIDVGKTATLVYLMRVGAGVRAGTLVNQAVASSITGEPISNVATAEVTLSSDPLIDESLILGTVFDDRDGDGWQDGAALTGIHVQGGFDASVYVPHSTTIDRGHGGQLQKDASAPLLHGLALGGIAARQSVADPAQRRQIVVSQRLTDTRFTDDFVLTSDQGVTLRMDKAGHTSIERSGDAAKGLNAAEPSVTRRVAQGAGGYVVDYVIGNAGVDERGIPGVRIASVDGLLMETDQFGRYHLAGVPGGAWERGRNFILKVDPATLPPGTQITTDNPLLRRITPGLPVRFDFGAKLPVELIRGNERKVELELGEVVFEPGSAQLREQYKPMLGQIAERISKYRNGEVVITADGDSEGLAFERATVVRDALLKQLPPELVQALTVSVRTKVDDPSTLVTGVTDGGALLGTLLFDTDRSTIRPEFAPLLDKIGAWLEQRKGGSIAIVGHADPRASDAYNVALGMRRARAVYEAIAMRLSPEVRSKVRVDSSNDPAAPAGTSGK